MPTDPTPNVTTSTLPAIENEIPAYRAISPEAVVALVLGLLSVLSFASWYFLVLPVAAVALGAAAERKIRRLPDVLTGRSLAQAGVGLGLIFGLTAVTVATVQGALRVRQAQGLARSYQRVLEEGSLADAVWYSQHPQMRASFTPDKIVESMTRSGTNKAMFDEQFRPVREIKKALAGKADMHFVRVEGHGDQDLTQYAGIVYAVHDDAAKKPDERERYVLAVLKWGGPSNPRSGWWVSDLVFPYKDKSFVAPTPEKKAGDDGHGHAH